MTAARAFFMPKAMAAACKNTEVSEWLEAMAEEEEEEALWYALIPDQEGSYGWDDGTFNRNKALLMLRDCLKDHPDAMLYVIYGDELVEKITADDIDD